MQAREDTTTLYEAARKGSVETLHELIQNDQLILHKASLTSFSETPLHVSALMGHLDFTNAILKLHPKMAAELDSLRRSPLHLASAEGHNEIVKALLLANKDVCLGRDDAGRIPLHLAAMRGRVEVVKELVTTRMESKYVLLDGDTVLHLCVRYNKLETLKLLVEMIHDDELVIMGNEGGNTILHLASMLKQVEAVRYLLSLPEIKAKANTLNKMGLTALDLLDQHPKDFQTPEIRELLIKEGVIRRASHEDIDKKLTINTSTIQATPLPDVTGACPKMSSILKSWLRILATHLDSHQGYWVEESRGSLMVVATVIATMSFQAAYAPPGGFWGEDFTESMAMYNCSSKNVCAAGTAIFAYTYGSEFFIFTIFNTVAFLASLSVIFLVLSGFSLQNQILVWLLTLAMDTAVTSMIATYLLALDMITPRKFTKFDIYQVEGNSYFYWFSLVIGVGAVHISRLVYLIGKGIHKLLHPLLVRKVNRTLEVQQAGYPGREENPSSVV